MKGSMHKMINGYGAGAVPLRQLEADGAAERGSSSRFDTNYTRQFVAHADNPSMHDHRRHRNTQKYPREANLTLSSTALGRLTGPFKGTLGLGQDPLASSFQRADPRMKRIREGGPRPENYGLSSGDVGNWRKAERPSQQHQEDPRIRQKDPVRELRNSRRKAAHEHQRSKQHRIREHAAKDWKQRPAEMQARSARSDLRESKTKMQEHVGGGASMTHRSFATTCTHTTIGGGVEHPLRTPKGVNKYWDRDDAVADMEASKAYVVPGLHTFFKPELETERSTARSQWQT